MYDKSMHGLGRIVLSVLGSYMRGSFHSSSKGALECGEKRALAVFGKEMRID